MGENPRPESVRNDGVTDAERYLKRLCDRTFLTFWSYPGVFRDQGKAGRGDGKEVCDLLVVFEDHIIIFSDKDCRFPDTGDIRVDWPRWFRRAVLDSAKQVMGAERWIRDHPARLYLDRACQTPFPVPLPEASRLKVHRVVVAHGSSARCKATLGGSGGLLITPAVVGEEHISPDGGKPFTIGQIDPSRGFVHVLDDASLDILLQTLDTISDLVQYLSRREVFLTSGRLITAASEEELLAHYLAKLNPDGEHDFVFPNGGEALVILDGFWESFCRSPERRSQLNANRASYLWDELIERFSQHWRENTLYFTTNPAFQDQERILRFLARESRTRRRMLSQALLGAIQRGDGRSRFLRVAVPSSVGDPYYCFLVLAQPEWSGDDDYRIVRRNFLHAACSVTKLQFPDAEYVVGIATEPKQTKYRSEDLIVLDGANWNEADRQQAIRDQEKLDLLTKGTWYGGTVYEYPSMNTEFPKGRRFDGTMSGEQRNQRCPCGSGQKYKRCCGRTGNR